MKKVIFSTSLILLLLFSNVAFALSYDNAKVKETWQEFRDGFLLHEEKKETVIKIPSYKDEIRQLGEEVSANTSAIKTVGKQVDGVGRRVDEVNEKIGSEASALSDQARKNAWLLAVALGGIMAFIGIIVIAFCRRKPDRTDEVLTAIQTAQGNINDNINETPRRVRDLMNTLDPSPFEFEVAGHQVIYQSPLEGIREGYYLILHAPANMAGTPQTYDRAHEFNRGIALRSVRKTMRMYLEGGFDSQKSKLQRELIKYLLKMGDITIKKIN